MKGKATKIFILLIIGISISSGQTKYPADTIRVSFMDRHMNELGHRLTAETFFQHFTQSHKAAEPTD